MAGSCCGCLSTTPSLPLNLESNSHGGVAQIAEKLKTFFQTHHDGVDVSPVEKL